MEGITAANVETKLRPDQADHGDACERLARNEPAIFEELVEMYGDRVHALARRLLNWSDGADDVTQDVFVALLRKGNSFRGDASIWTFLATVTVNRCRSLQRRTWLYERVLRSFVPRRTLEPATKLSSDMDGTGQ